MGHQVLILLMQSRDCINEIANDYRVKMGSKTKTYVNMLKKYIAREPNIEVDMVPTTDGATLAVAGVIHEGH